MEDRIALIRRYQSYNPATRRFDLERTQDEYAALLGLSQSYLSRLYSGERRMAGKAVIALLQRFPEAAEQIAHAVSREAEPVAVA